MTANSQLHDAIAAVCPIVGVGIGDPADKSTWRVDFAPGVTAQQMAAAQGVITAFVWVGDGAYIEIDGVVTPNIPVMRALQSASIDAAWAAANSATFLFGGHPIGMDETGSKNINSIATGIALTGALPAGYPGYWKAADNFPVPVVDVATFKQMYAAMIAQGLTNFAHAQTQKAAIAAATTPDQIAAIVW